MNFQRQKVLSLPLVFKQFQPPCVYNIYSYKKSVAKFLTMTKILSNFSENAFIAANIVSTRLENIFHFFALTVCF